ANEAIRSAANAVTKAQEIGSILGPALAECKVASSKKSPSPKDPPIDNITHTVQFLVATYGSATPSWNLVRFKSNTSPAFAALVHNNTQTLIIALGPTSSQKPGANQELVNTQLLQ